MKHLKTSIAALLAACLLLTGCDNSAKNDPSDTENISDSSSSINENSAPQGDPDSSNLSGNAEKPEMPAETEQILKLMKDYANLEYGMQPSDFTELEKIADKSNKISVDGIEYLKLTNAPANTITQLNEKLDSLVTGELKNDFLDFVTNDNYGYLIKDDNIYISEECFVSEPDEGMDRLYLDSIEYPDENTILVNMTSFGDKNKRGTEKDIEDSFTVTLVRTDNGLRIEEYYSMAVAYIYYYNEVFYGDISFRF